MATSGKKNKTEPTKPTHTDKDSVNAASSVPVVSSTPLPASAPVASRIPQSNPINSTLVGESHTPIPAAGRKKKSPDTAMPTPSEKPIQPEAQRPQSVPASSIQTKVVKKGGFWPMALGGVFSAGVGAAAAIWAMPYLALYIGQPLSSESSPQIDIEAIKSEAIAAASEAGADAGLEAANKAIATLPAQEIGGTDVLQGELKMQAGKIQALQDALANIPTVTGTTSAQNQVTSAETSSADEINALRQELAVQAQKIADLSARPQLDPQAIEQVRTLAANSEKIKQEIDSAASRAQESLKAVQSEAEEAAKRAQAVASIAALSAALEHGGSPDKAVKQLENSGVEVPEPLTQDDLPTLAQIQIGFDSVARQALRASLQAASSKSSPLSAVGNFLRVQTGARSIEPREGSDPDAILSRAGALIEQGELKTALEELSALPPEGQKAMAEWAAQVQAYLDAETALNNVAATLN